MKQKDKPMELSYYRLTLLSFLKESHPELSDDTDFIKSRADEASEVHADAIKNGALQTEAEELANLVLFRGLLFSKQDMIIHILWNEFSDIIPQSQAKEFAQRILNQCESIFVQYPLSDEFADSTEYEQLYTELTGFIDLWLEANEL